MVKIKNNLYVFLLVILAFFVCSGKSFAADATISEDGYPEIGVSCTNNYDYAKEVLLKVNNERSNVGVSSLKIDKELTEAAMQRAAEISILFEHERPNGETCFTVCDKAWGENIAAYQTTPTAVMNSWMNSEGHKANILKSDWKSIGIGCAKINNKYYWVQLFSPYESEDEDVENGTKSVTTKVEVPLSNFNVSAGGKSSLELEVGKEASLKTTFLYNDETIAIDNSEITYSIDEESIAVIEDGKIKALRVGTVTVTATVGTNSTTCTVKVVPNEISVYYKTHVQNVGWQNYVKNGAMSGTSGKSLRLE